MGTNRRAGGLALAAALLVGCDGGVVVSEGERRALADYEEAAADGARAFESLGAATDALDAQLEADADDAAVDAAIDALATEVAALERAVQDLEEAELELRRASYGDAPGVRRDALAGAVLYVVGVAAFAVTMRALSDRMSQTRTRRDQALEREDFTAYERERAEMRSLGAQAAQQLVTKVLPNPVRRAASLVPGAELVITAQSAISDVTTLAATDACRVAPDSDECRFGASTADSGAVVVIPAGELQITVTAPGLARTVVDGVVVAEGERVTLEVDLPAHADLPGENDGDIQHCYGHFGCFDGTSDWLPTECASEGGTPMPGPCP